MASRTEWASILLPLHTEGCRAIGSHCEVCGLRCFHHDALWQHNYALYLTSHGSPNHISNSSGSSSTAAAAVVEKLRDAGGGGEEVWSSDPGAKQMQRSGRRLESRHRGAEKGCQRSGSGLSLCINVRLRALARRAGSWDTEGQGWQRSVRSRKREC